LTVTDTAGCTQTASVTLVDPAAPTVTIAFSIDTVCTLDAPVTLSGGSPAGGTYSGTAVSSGIFTPASAAVGANTITYTYTDANTGCSGSSTDVIYVDPCAGIAESNISAVSFSVYPNPNNGTFTVLNSSVNAGDIAVYDAQGRVVQSVRLTGGAQSQITIDVAGIYMIRMIDANGNSAVQQVIVE
jgi:large repetitive protein